MNSKKFVRKAWVLSGLFALCFLLPSPSVFAESARDLNNRMSRLENEMETLSRAIYRGEKPPPSASGGLTSQGDVEIRLQQFEQELQKMRGKLEEQSYATRKLGEQLERVTSDLEMRINELEGKGSSMHTGAVRNGGSYIAQKGSSDLPEETVPVTQKDQGYKWTSNVDQEASSGKLGVYTRSSDGYLNGSSGTVDSASSSYENAFALLKNSQYDAAEKGFQDFIDRYPDHALVSNAKYWLGETFYVKGDFEQAARIFAEGYQQYPQGPKAADNLLKLGMSLAGMGKKEDACVALAQLDKEKISSSTPVMRRAAQERSRLGCS